MIDLHTLHVKSSEQPKLVYSFRKHLVINASFTKSLNLANDTFLSKYPQRLLLIYRHL